MVKSCTLFLSSMISRRRRPPSAAGSVATLPARSVEQMCFAERRICSVLLARRSENAKSGVSARYPRTALDPHHPSICTVMGSSPHAERVLAPVILNVCPETSRNYPIAFCIVTPDDTIASLIMSTIAAFVHLPLETLAAQGPVVLPSRRRSLSYSRMM